MDTTSKFDFPYPEAQDAPDVPLYVNALADKLDSELYRIDGTPPYPLGIIARARRTSNLTPASQASFTSYQALAVRGNVLAGRAYRIQAPCAGWFSTAYGLVRPALRYTTNDTAPTGSSALMVETGLELSNANNVEAATVTGYWLPTVNQVLRVGLFWQRVQGGSAITSYAAGEWPLHLYIEDIGKVS